MNNFLKVVNIKSVPVLSVCQDEDFKKNTHLVTQSHL